MPPAGASDSLPDAPDSLPGAADSDPGLAGTLPDSPDIVVTASRVNASGFTAPTPTTVLGSEDIARTAPVQISEALSQIPAFRTTSPTSSAAVSANLRSVGSTRTLVLVDGRRHVPTQSDGTIDLNLIPANLVARTEVVTGGASASWGSDAVAGVVNLILDTKLEGLRASVQAGQSKYGDAETLAASLAGGFSFAGGRGRLVAGGEYARDEGVGRLGAPEFSRPWAREDRGFITNTAFATNGLPNVIYTRGARIASASRGGLIINGPLRGTSFDANGNPTPFGFGQVFGAQMIGGTGNIGDSANSNGADARLPFERYSALAHGEFDITDGITIFGEASLAHSLATGRTNNIRALGSVTTNATCATTTSTGVGAVFVNINNPYIPPATRAAMVAANITCIQVGRNFGDIENVRPNDGSPIVARGVVGLRGQFGGGWSWDTYYQYGYNESQQKRRGNLFIPNFRLAIDAVTGPGGQIVCRSTLANPTNGCVPLNIFGENSVTPEAAAYVTGNSSLENVIKQKVAAFNLRGEPLSTWAGPIAIAAGAEYRKESLKAVADPNSEASLFQSGHRRSAQGSFNVKEVYGEVVVPLAKDQWFAHALSLNGAVRYTDYSSSGGVTTWKVGATWEITDDLLVRGTRSRDIRAGNLSELFTPQAISTVALTDRRPGGANNQPTQVLTTGNATLDPERADTLTVGASYSPHWANGLRLSVDYYKIDIDGVIGTVTPQQIIDQCQVFNVQSFCGQITFSASDLISRVTTGFVNLNKPETSGLDIELSYRKNLSDISDRLSGTVDARLLATHVFELATTQSIGGSVLDPTGQFDNPEDAVTFLLNYDNGPFAAGLDVRWYEGGTVDNTLVPGGTGVFGTNIAHIGSTTYTNVSSSYDITEQLQVFARINNLFNVPPPFPSNGGGIFDVTGRAYRLGLRFKL